MTMDTVEKALTAMLKIIETPDITDDEYALYLFSVSKIRFLIGWRQEVWRPTDELRKAIESDSPRHHLKQVANLLPVTVTNLEVDREDDIDHIQKMLVEWRALTGTKNARQTTDLAAE
jgi:hypothetical protein